MKDKWTEEQVASFPRGEHDYFDRKSGKLLGDSDCRTKLAKAVSAFANSGGGQILFGVEDDGAFDGVAVIARGRQSTREWLEQIVPNLVVPALTKFRVHEVVPSEASNIPSKMVVIVIDIDDSPHAPHQSEADKTYYYRSGGHSVPAPHFYLEALRNRLIKPVFESSVGKVRPIMAHWHSDGLFVQFLLSVNVRNIGRVMARYLTTDISCANASINSRGDFRRGRLAGVGVQYETRDLAPLTTPLLPTLSKRLDVVFGVNLRPSGRTEAAIAASVEAFLTEGPSLEYSIVCETHRTEPLPLSDQELRQAVAGCPIISVLPEPLKGGASYAGHGIYITEFSIDDVEIGRHISFQCLIENRSDCHYRDLTLDVAFRNHEGHIIASSKETLATLAPDQLRPFASWINGNDIIGYESIHIVAAPESENLASQ